MAVTILLMQEGRHVSTLQAFMAELRKDTHGPNTGLRGRVDYLAGRLASSPEEVAQVLNDLGVLMEELEGNMADLQRKLRKADRLEVTQCVCIPGLSLSW